MMDNNKMWLPALMVAVTLFSAYAQSSYMGSNQGYASDKFEGFEAFDKDTRLPQKEKSFWYSVSEETAAAQLVYAAKKAAAGKSKSARKAYEALVRQWPTAPEAAHAQLALAQLFEKMEKYGQAFDEYQYLLTYFAGHCPYNEVLDRQFRIANLLLHGNKSMFGWALNGTDTIRERFEKIVLNAPRAAIARTSAWSLPRSFTPGADSTPLFTSTTRAPDSCKASRMFSGPSPPDRTQVFSGWARW